MTAVQVPAHARLVLSHGVLQLIADEADIPILHIKGPAVDEELLQRDPDGTRTPRQSSDADVWVSPQHVAQYQALLEERGWACTTGFTAGSTFRHAMNLHHPKLGNVDLHRTFPGFGIDPQASFDLLWQTSQPAELGSVLCWVPDLTGQRLVLLLHAARAGGPRHPDVQRCWHDASPAEQAAVRELAAEVKAELPLAAALGQLDDFRSHRDYRLWRHFADPERTKSRLDEWLGRWYSARGVRAKASVMRQFLALDRETVAVELGHAPSEAELKAARRERRRALRHELRAKLGGKRQ